MLCCGIPGAFLGGSGLLVCPRAAVPPVLVPSRNLPFRPLRHCLIGCAAPDSAIFMEDTAADVKRKVDIRYIFMCVE